MGISGHGGARTGGSRPSPWQYQPTCTIRVPEILAETLLEIARELDKGLEETLIIDPKSHGINRQVKKEVLSLSQLRIYKHSRHKFLRLEKLIRALQSGFE
ncbi:MAG TPA: hypothetical protein V6D11_00605 [Waterburya sp.]|jgi:hypothetical protein